MKMEEALMIAKDNKEAASFLVSFVGFCHMFDDVVDKDVPVDDERLVRDSLAFIENLILNQFVQTNKVVLWPLIVCGFNAWLDANKWAKSGTAVQKRDVDVLKGTYHEVCYFTARLCGGLEHMRSLTPVHRSYDHDSEKG